MLVLPPAEACVARFWKSGRKRKATANWLCTFFFPGCKCIDSVFEYQKYLLDPLVTFVLQYKFVCTKVFTANIDSIPEFRCSLCPLVEL